MGTLKQWIVGSMALVGFAGFMQSISVAQTGRKLMKSTPYRDGP